MNNWEKKRWTKNYWAHHVWKEGFEEGFSVFALRYMKAIILNEFLLDLHMEKSGTKGYHRAYYMMNRERRKERDEARIRRKFGMTKYEYEQEYYHKNKKKIDGQRHKCQRRLREQAKHEGMWE